MSELISATISLPIEVIAKALAMQIPVDRHSAMVERYGEACTKATAAKVIECSVTTIDRMIEDGRIKLACEGTKIDVRSLADYIERKPEIDRKTRYNKRYKGAAMYQV